MQRLWIRRLGTYLERQRPLYALAAAAELLSVTHDEYNFQGIGMPRDLIQ